MKPLKIACIGEAMVELSLSADDPSTAKVGFAGDTLNTAIYLKRSGGAKLDVSYVTRLGRDAFSANMVNFIKDEDISTESITYSDNRTVGLYAITTDSIGERSFSYWRDTSAARELFQSGGSTAFDVLENFDILYFSAITLAILPNEVRLALIDWLPAWKSRTGGSVVFDSNYRPALWQGSRIAKDIVGQVWQLTDIALPTIDDEIAIFGDASEADIISRLHAAGISQGALKCGKNGPVSLGVSISNETYSAAPKTVDTTAAGDSFNGGYLAAMLTGADQLSALRAGHTLAAKVVGVKGAIIPRGTQSK